MDFVLPPAALPGDSLEQVATPALLLDLDAFEDNLRRMAQLAAVNGVVLRPHAKAHKSTAIAKAQVAAGAVGICCQKLSEALPFAAAGIADIHISNEFVGADKLALAIALARQVKLSICVDHPAQVVAVGSAAAAAGVVIHVLAEVDVGQHRCGVMRGEDLLTLVRAVQACPALHFSGIQAYHGGAQHIAAWKQRRQAASEAAARTGEFLRVLDANGIECAVVSGGGTGTAEFDARSGVYTELQPGSYVFLDRQYAANAWQGEPQPQNGLFLLTTVMSVAQTGRAVCDVGLKSVAVDAGLPVVAPADRWAHLRYLAANDEHGVLEIPAHDVGPALGEKLMLLPGHCDPTVNLHEQYVCLRGGRVIDCWPIEARGLSR